MEAVNVEQSGLLRKLHLGGKIDKGKRLIAGGGRRRRRETQE